MTDTPKHLSLLYEAIENNNLKTIKYLLDKHPKLRFYNDDILLFACKHYKDNSIIEELHKYNIAISINVLEYLLVKYMYGEAELLLTIYIEQNYQPNDKYFHVSILNIICLYGAKYLLKKIFLKRGLDINGLDNNGNNVLQNICNSKKPYYEQYPKIANYLIMYGINVSNSNVYGINALIYALNTNQKEIAYKLFKITDCTNNQLYMMYELNVNIAFCGNKNSLDKQKIFRIASQLDNISLFMRLCNNNMLFDISATEQHINILEQYIHCSSMNYSKKKQYKNIIYDKFLENQGML